MQTSSDSEQLTGTWHVTSGIITFILNIEPDRGGVLIEIEKGSSDIRRVIWEPQPGGLITLTPPRFRLWLGRHPDECRAEIEDLSEWDVSDTLKQFPQAFFMRRIRPPDLETVKRLNAHPYPARWRDGSVPVGWDNKAGKRRNPKM